MTGLKKALVVQPFDPESYKPGRSSRDGAGSGSSGAVMPDGFNTGAESVTSESYEIDSIYGDNTTPEGGGSSSPSGISPGTGGKGQIGAGGSEGEEEGNSASGDEAVALVGHDAGSQGTGPGSGQGESTPVGGIAPKGILLPKGEIGSQEASNGVIAEAESGTEPENGTSGRPGRGNAGKGTTPVSGLQDSGTSAEERLQSSGMSVNDADTSANGSGTSANAEAPISDFRMDAAVQDFNVPNAPIEAQTGASAGSIFRKQAGISQAAFGIPGEAHYVVAFNPITMSYEVYNARVLLDSEIGTPVSENERLKAMKDPRINAGVSTTAKSTAADINALLVIILIAVAVAVLLFVIFSKLKPLRK